VATFVPLTGGAQIEIVFTLDGQIIQNRLWFWNADRVPDSADLLGLADGVYDWHTSLILPSLSDQLQLATVVARDWSVPLGPFEVTTGPPINGGVSEESHSANVAVVVPFRWPLQFGRLKKNKNYVPGVPLSQIDLNTPTSSINSVLFEGYAALIDAARVFAPSDFWYWVVTSAIADNTPRDEQEFGLSIGPEPGKPFILGQRRRRLPA